MIILEIFLITSRIWFLFFFHFEPPLFNLKIKYSSFSNEWQSIWKHITIVFVWEIIISFYISYFLFSNDYHYMNEDLFCYFIALIKLFFDQYPWKINLTIVFLTEGCKINMNIPNKYFYFTSWLNNQLLECILNHRKIIVTTRNSSRLQLLNKFKKYGIYFNHISWKKSHLQIIYLPHNKI